VGPGHQREKEEGHIPIWGSGLAGPGPLLGLGQLVSLAALFIFFVLLFLFFYFLIYFITFAKLVQINSIQFLHFSKIQHKVLNQ
jgi:hypothetical protein